MRVGIYTDYAYHRAGGELFAERAFALFLTRLAGSFDRVTLIGRERPSAEGARYDVGRSVELISLPYYRSLAEPSRVLRASARAMWVFWHALPDLDCIWILGPHPFGIAFVLLAALRRKRIVLGVRQDTPAYVRSRHPKRRSLHLAADLMDRVWRGLARIYPVVVVGPSIARHYRRARSPLEIAVSLVEERDIVEPDAAALRSYDGELRILSVGRLEQEKNPLLMADVLARLTPGADRWHLIVCGEGPLEAELERRTEELGVRDRIELRGYVPFGPSLHELYRESHALLHVSLTEGLPQVLLEAFAAGLPVVATDVGGIRDAVGEAALLVPPDDAAAAARALEEIGADPELRERLVRAGNRYVAGHTANVEARRLADFLHGA